jgi:hypothetical protein
LSLRLLTVLISFAAIACLGARMVSTASAQQPNVSIAELDCDGTPERVVILNSADAQQDLQGWRLESDPPGRETFSLSGSGRLSPHHSVTIESGLNAQGPFIWLAGEVFRNDDPTDYVRLLDDMGDVMQEVTCATGTENVSPAAPLQTSAPSAVMAGAAPAGGGPPSPPSPAFLYPFTLFVGGSMTLAGLLAIALSTRGVYLVRRSAGKAGAPADARENVGMGSEVSSGRAAGGSGRTLAIVAVAGLLLVMWGFWLNGRARTRAGERPSHKTIRGAAGQFYPYPGAFTRRDQPINQP